jgi:hypothetical protein
MEGRCICGLSCEIKTVQVFAQQVTPGWWFSFLVKQNISTSGIAA